MPTESLIDWPKPVSELFGFIAAFLITGAIGFRFAALGGLLNSAASDEKGFAQGTARRAALFGLLGAAIGTARMLQGLPAAAERQHLGIAALVTSQPVLQLQMALLFATLLGFALAAGGRGVGWAIAAVGVALLPLRAALFGEFLRVVKPVHEYAAGYWIGTLFLIVTLGLSPAFRGALSAERHAAVVARMVAGFSRLALTSFGVLAVFGVITAVRNLKRIESLWTTPYGITYVAKMCVVLGVLAFGAWNWRRQKPRLGTAAAAAALRGSATRELAAAGVVLLITSVLVSLPSPK
ncbi:MAG: CopD family protein [Candidatus Eisenbacteria bacterium]